MPDALSTGPSPSPLSVLVIDDHAVVRRGVRALLETQPEFRVVAKASDVPSALEAVQTHQQSTDPAWLFLRMTAPQGLREHSLANVATTAPFDYAAPLVDLEGLTSEWRAVLVERGGSWPHLVPAAGVGGTSL